MPNTKNELYDLLSLNIGKTKKELADLVCKQNKSCVFLSGLQNKLNGKIGYISCFPQGKKTEESLDGIYLISEFPDHLEISVEISWSNGIFVDNIGKYTFLLNMNDKFPSPKWEVIETNLIKKMNHILENYFNDWN